MKRPSKADRQNNAEQSAMEICHEAFLRNIPAEVVCGTLMRVLAGRNAELAGEVLYGVSEAIRQYPVKKVITQVQ